MVQGGWKSEYIAGGWVVCVCLSDILFDTYFGEF